MLKKYKKFVNSMRFYPKEAGIVYTTLGLTGEAGEVAEEIKKTLRDDKGIMGEERRNRVIKELGDVIWYAQALCLELDIELTDVIQQNMDKLTKRHGERRKRPHWKEPTRARC